MRTQAAAESWRWHPCDRDLFARTFRALGAARSLAELRRGVAQSRAPRAAAAAAVARAERELLLAVVEAYQERVWAALDDEVVRVEAIGAGFAEGSAPDAPEREAEGEATAALERSAALRY